MAFRRFVLIGFLSLAFIFEGCKNSTENQKIVLKLGHSANEKNLWHQSVLYFAGQVDSLSAGSIEVRLFPSEQLGSEIDVVRSIGLGTVDMTITGESMQNWAQITSFCGTPYLIKDFDHLDRVIASEVGNKISDEMIDKIGLKPLAYFARGPRHLTSNRPITTPDDLNGLIVRVPSVPVSVAVWEALGAKPTPMALSEVFTALQSGAVEAQENPFALIHSAGFYEVQEYVNLTSHVIGWVYVVIGEQKFNTFTLEQQQILIKAGIAMQKFHQDSFLKQEDQLRNDLVEKGMKMVEVDMDSFRLKASEAVKNKLPLDLIPVYTQIQNMAE